MIFIGVQYGADKIIKDKSGKYPLDYAVKTGLSNIVLHLTDSKVSVENAIKVAKELPSSCERDDILRYLKSFSSVKKIRWSNQKSI